MKGYDLEYEVISRVMTPLSDDFEARSRRSRTERDAHKIKRDELDELNRRVHPPLTRLACRLWSRWEQLSVICARLLGDVFQLSTRHAMFRPMSLRHARVILSLGRTREPVRWLSYEGGGACYVMIDNVVPKEVVCTKRNGRAVCHAVVRIQLDIWSATISLGDTHAYYTVPRTFLCLTGPHRTSTLR